MAKIYLTIDDSPSSRFKEKLDHLNSKNIKAIWFCIGGQIAGHEQELVEALKTGHILANHSMTHPRFSSISIDQAQAEITNTDLLISKLYDQAAIHRDYKFFRFPYGDQGDVENGQQSFKSERLDHRQKLRQYLIDQNFMPGPFGTTQYDRKYIRNKVDDPNWGWSYDLEEWAIEYGGKYTAEQISQKLEAYLNNYDRDLDQIMLIHDHEKSSDLFIVLIDQIINSGTIISKISH